MTVGAVLDRIMIVDEIGYGKKMFDDVCKYTHYDPGVAGGDKFLGFICPCCRYSPTERQSRADVAEFNELSDEDKKIIAMVIRGVDVTEVFSPPRVATACAKLGMTPGSSMDLTTGWDFTKVADRNRAAR